MERLWTDRSVNVILLLGLSPSSDLGLIPSSKYPFIIRKGRDNFFLTCPWSHEKAHRVTERVGFEECG